jgi:hypothetical protein
MPLWCHARSADDDLTSRATDSRLHLTDRTHAMNAVQFHDASRFVLRFESLFDPGRGLAFPCDERGNVVLDSLSERARRNYFYARVVVGHEFATPAVVRTDD